MARSFSYAPRDGNVFQRLFSVTITHSFYTQDDGLCPDFRIIASPATAKLMDSLGMLLRNDGTGFSVLIRPDGIPGLINYIRRASLPAGDVDSPDALGFWSRLTFLMLSINPLFVGITALPIDTKPTEVNFYCCNVDAHREDDGRTLLSKGDYVDGDALYPTIGSSTTLAVPPQTRFVTFSDISGAVAERWKVPVPEALIASGGTVSVPLDLSDLDYDFYTIGLEDARRQPIAASGYPRSVLYVPSKPLTMGVVDIVFTRPTPDSAGVYPLSPLFGRSSHTGKPTHVNYVLPFEARPTYWQYYIVSQSAGGSLSNLKINGSGARFRQRRQPVALPDGSSAILFQALTTLPLQQKSTQRLQLTGQRQDADGRTSAILVSALPVAPSAPVWPGPADKTATGTSEMFIYV